VFAAKLRGFGLQTDSIVAIQLPNIVESIVAFLGVLRAGMIATPMPLLWGHQDIVAALGQIDAKAIITCSRIGAVAYAERARQAAVELFSIRHVCGLVPIYPTASCRSTASLAPALPMFRQPIPGRALPPSMSRP
jgi:acyl-coenzyme A synthetase/AMP-(fatty) acid ligase